MESSNGFPVVAAVAVEKFVEIVLPTAHFRYAGESYYLALLQTFPSQLLLEESQ